MADTYTQLYVQLIFSPKNRKALIQKKWKNELEKYITGIIQSEEHKLIAIGAMPDHIHIFIGLNPKQSISDLVRIIKTSSNRWINENKLSPYKFSWQKGFGAFSYSRSQISRVSNYVLNQDEHHRKRNFKEEYYDILIKNGIDFDEKYLFDFFD